MANLVQELSNLKLNFQSAERGAPCGVCVTAAAEGSEPWSSSSPVSRRHELSLVFGVPRIDPR